MKTVGKSMQDGLSTLWDLLGYPEETKEEMFQQLTRILNLKSNETIVHASDLTEKDINNEVEFSGLKGQLSDFYWDKEERSYYIYLVVDSKIHRVKKTEWILVRK